MTNEGYTDERRRATIQRILDVGKLVEVAPFLDGFYLVYGTDPISMYAMARITSDNGDGKGLKLKVDDIEMALTVDQVGEGLPQVTGVWASPGRRKRGQFVQLCERALKDFGVLSYRLSKNVTGYEVQTTLNEGSHAVYRVSDGKLCKTTWEGNQLKIDGYTTTSDYVVVRWAYKLDYIPLTLLNATWNHVTQL